VETLVLSMLRQQQDVSEVHLGWEGDTSSAS
jgi:hypothetical protein